MSKAIKCDRCKRCFDPYKEPGDFARIENYVLRNASQYYNNECSYHDDEIDFCPDCANAFAIFMKGERSLAVAERNRLQNSLTHIQMSANNVEATAEKLGEIFDGNTTGYSELDGCIRALLSIIHLSCGDSGRTDDSICNGKPAERESEPEQKGDH